MVIRYNKPAVPLGTRGECMAAEKTDRERFFGRLFNYANNWLTIAGVVLTTLSALMIIVFMLVELSGELENPYIGIFAYVVLPGLFVLGLIEIPIGMWRRRTIHSTRKARRSLYSREIRPQRILGAYPLTIDP